jgi:hypothetical protein
MASFAVCSGWVILSTGVLERWMGWWIVVAGLGLVVARFAWDGRVLGRWLGTVLAVDHRGLYPTDRAARPVEQRRTLRPDRWSNAAR